MPSWQLLVAALLGSLNSVGFWYLATAYLITFAEYFAFICYNSYSGFFLQRRIKKK
jgi:hypothetical protein